jgi:hypothetical protein
MLEAEGYFEFDIEKWRTSACINVNLVHLLEDIIACYHVLLCSLLLTSAVSTFVVS